MRIVQPRSILIFNQHHVVSNLYVFYVEHNRRYFKTFFFSLHKMKVNGVQSCFDNSSKYLLVHPTGANQMGLKQHESE